LGHVLGIGNEACQSNHSRRVWEASSEGKLLRSRRGFGDPQVYLRQALVSARGLGPEYRVVAEPPVPAACALNCIAALAVVESAAMTRAAEHTEPVSPTAAEKPQPPIRRAAVVGGTFDPIHHGHLVAAEEARVQLGLDHIFIVPARQQPLKGNDSADPEDRYMMAVLATATHPRITVSRVELDRPGRSYTIETIRAFRRHLGPDCSIYFMVGADAVLELPSWLEPDAILDECQFVAVHRPGYDITQLPARLGDERAAKIVTLEIPQLEISSTQIRERVRRGMSIKYLVPEAVEAFILKTGLYGADND
jgi:nicotinate-nucleotide adenylyltransferase